MKIKENKAITLVALIITIIILLILAGVSLSMVLGENGLINKAQSSVDKYKESSENEQELLNKVEDYFNKLEKNESNKVEDKKEGEIELSATSGECTYPNTITFDVIKNTSGGELSVKTANEDIATATISGNKITVTPKNVDGTATITVTSAETKEYKEISIKYNLKVKSKVFGASISNTKSYVGKYADVDGDGTVDGVIYADLAIGGSGTWNPSGDENYTDDGIYTIPKITSGLKEYCVSQKSYTNVINGEQEVVEAKSTNGTPRFYVMALTDIDGKQNGTLYDWYNSADKTKMKDWDRVTSVEFGQGNINTKIMITKWNDKAYGIQNNCSNHKDVWGQIQSHIDKGWFIPSRTEWAAYAGNLKIDKTNYPTKGVSNWYWASSQYNTERAWAITFYYGSLFGGEVKNDYHLRLSKVF